MPRPRTLNPTYLLHPQSGQAHVRIREGSRYRDIYLGEYNSPESWAKYHRMEIGQQNGFSRKVDESKLELFAKPKIHESLVYFGLTINPLRQKYRR